MSAVITFIQWILYAVLAAFTTYSVYFIEYQRGLRNRNDDLDIPEASQIASDIMFPQKSYSYSVVEDSTARNIYDPPDGFAFSFTATEPFKQ
ncbi:hypothetical protein AAVH_01419 [Aphelenchoides avenae]|nr:hypothetical protein AAVH_01419 [Aphelenchus avenae]